MPALGPHSEPYGRIRSAGQRPVGRQRPKALRSNALAMLPWAVLAAPPAAGAADAPKSTAVPADLAQALALRDIQPPGTPGLWPPAPGWWVAIALALAALATLGFRAWRVHRARVRRAHILVELAGIGGAAQGAELAAAVSALLKRVALARFARAEVAPLTGEAWLDFLDRHGGAGRFTTGPGRVLAEGPYAPAPDLDPQVLVDLARDWVRRNT
jgi:hypothetical protein